ncbi:hypothetical protein [Nonomuraea glycinis]|uniref:hypothetical protein n=1 Tax=Nonomuraea glycinis TaxID=2047744 RepID=UPI002E13DB8F|nr:hypothetical protein OHA68_35290 [Nonomuraea glycinis]
MSVTEDRMTPDCAAMLSAYAADLTCSSLADTSRTAYFHRVRGFLTWVAGSGDGVPADTSAAVRTAHRYRRHLHDRGYSPATINSVLVAIDDLYTRRGLGATGIRQPSTPVPAPGPR